MQKEYKNNIEKIDLEEWIKVAKRFASQIFSDIKSLLLFTLFGGLIGFTYAWFYPVKYISKLTFVLEESKNGVGGLASIAGQFGIDLGGAAGGGVFSGDNILVFLKSESLIRQTLFTEYDEQTKKTLADQYAEAHGLKKEWAKNKKIGVIDFSKHDPKNLPRNEDSLVQEITKLIIDESLSVSKIDKKSSFIEIKTIMRDELLSKFFSERLVQIAIDRYVSSKTKVKISNIDKLQAKSDSLALILNNKTYSTATSQQQLVDVNPAVRLAPIATEINTREKTIALTLYAEVVKNLELSRTILNQVTPVIEIVDQSNFPLEKIRVNKIKSTLFGLLISFIGVLFFRFISFWFMLLRKNDQNF